MIEVTGCLDDNEASEFASGSLGAGATTRIEKHLAGCRDCRSLVAALAPDLEEADADSDVVTSPRRVAKGKRAGKRAHDIAMAPTEEPRSPDTPDTTPKKRRDPVVAAGDTIGRYIILARLGAGGMGVVYTAYDPQLDRKVAVKLLRTGGGIADDEARQRLVREAQAMSQLAHPNVVAVYDVGTADTGEVYVAMELVDGETLTSWLGHWDRSWREILDLFFQAGRGLSAAHARGLVHRDFKPDNVLVGTDGRVRVTDFGLARSLLDQVEEELRDMPRPDLEALRATLTATGTVLGTPRYMAPEQLRGADADARSDQFSFCVALFEALYGRHPLPGDSVIEMVQHGAVAEAPPEDTKVPAAIGRAIFRGLSSEPNRRFPTLAGLLVEATPPPTHGGRRGWMAVAAALALVTAGAAAAMVMMQSKADSDVGELRIKLREAEARVKALEEQINRLAYADGGLTDKIHQLRDLQTQLATARAKLEELEAQIAQPDAAPQVVRPTRTRPDAGPPPVKPLGAADFARSAAAQDGRIRSCMGDWLERTGDPNTAFEVVYQIAPDGSVRSATTRGLDDVVTDCVAGAVRDGRYSSSQAVTFARTAVSVEAGEITIRSEITGATEPGEQIDLGGH
jgi:serine/threonine protein kinase